MAVALKSTGVDVHYVNYPGAVHGFLRHHAQSKLADMALSDIGTRVRKLLR